MRDEPHIPRTNPPVPPAKVLKVIHEITVKVEADEFLERAMKIVNDYRRSHIMSWNKPSE